MLSTEAIVEYKRIYFEEFGVKLSDQEALEKATRLLGLFKAVYRPMKKGCKYHETQKMH